MTNPEEHGGSPVEGATRSRTRRLRWWVSGITFVVGVVVGIVAVGLLSAGTPEFAAGAGPGAGTAAPTIAPSPGGSVPVVAEARVNAACLAVINDAQDVYSTLTGLEEAVTDVDLQALDDIVRQLQPVEARLGRDLPQCQVNTEVINDPGGTGSPPPASPTPSVSPTR